VSYEAAMVNNDALATAMYSAILYLLVLTVRDGSSTRRAAILGVAAGVGLLAKTTTIMALVLIPAALWLGRRDKQWPAVLREIALAYVAALIIVGPWWWYMIRTYGDPLAFSALAATQPDLTRQNATFLQLLFSGRFAVDRWIETWGEFGWKLIHVSAALVTALAVATAAALAGLAVHVAAGPPHADAETRRRAQAIGLIAAACVLSYLGTVQFGVRFVLTQARYFFPVVNAAVLLAMLGLRAWIPPRWRATAQALVVLAAIAVNVTIYTAYVVPYWYFRP
jgi:4-amino-4-deoxy-L-arabinose transferase-like glycosyltransferase